MTDADGVARFTLPDDAEHVTMTVARQGSMPVETIYRATREEIDAEIARAGELYVVLEPPAGPPDEYVTITARSTVPFCISVDVWDVCTMRGMVTARAVRSNEPLRVVATSIDLEGCPLELIDTTISDSLFDREIDLVFDGSGRTDATLHRFAVRLPADAASSFQQYGLYTGGRFPLLVQDPAATRIIGGACDERVSADGMTVEMTAAWFETEGEEPLFDILAFPDTPGVHDGSVLELSYRRLFGPPAMGGLYPLMDVPRISPQMNLDLATTFESQPVDGANVYALGVLDARSGGLLWHARSYRPQPITLPALPDGYSTIDWPLSCAGLFRIFACEHTGAEPTLYGARCAASRAEPGILTR
jgi:hypothetical protein